jgi:hydroxymethylpyrimidine pyrophosphatase-like HAD family hydrolase
MRIAIDFDDTLVFYNNDLTNYQVNQKLVDLCNVLMDRGFDIFIVTARCIGTQRDNINQRLSCSNYHGQKNDYVMQLIKQGLIPTVEGFCNTHFKDHKIAGIIYTDGGLKGNILKNNQISVMIDDSHTQRTDANSHSILAYDVNQLDDFAKLIQLIEADMFWKK